MRLEKTIPEIPFKALIKKKLKETREGTNTHYIEIKYNDEGEIISIDTTDPELLDESIKAGFIQK